MLKNYLLIGFRNLTKNYLYVMANLIGLSFGIACSILAYFIWEFHENFDGIHSKSETIYRVQTVRSDDQKLYTYGTSPMPLALHIEDGNIGIVSKARYNIHNEVIKKNETVLYQQVAYVDPSFTTIFDFPVYMGSSDLNDPNSAIISENTAIRFFGNDEVVGKQLQLQTKNGLQLFTINGVMKDHLLNSSFKFDLLLNYETYLTNYNVDEDDWSVFSHVTFIELSNPQSAEDFTQSIQRYIPVFNNSREDWVAEEFTLVNLQDMSVVSRQIRGNYLGANNPEGAVMIPVIMALIVLLVACFNYMNTSISLSSTRLKEIGVRKSVGAHRSQLIVQLLTENIVLIAFSLIGGLFLVEFLAPAYNQLGPWVEIIPSYGNNLGAMTYLLVLLFATAILSGGYPAFYVSKFQATQIFNGRLKLKSSGSLSKVLMVLQLSFSLISLIQGIVYIQNTSLQEQFDIGYKKHGVITVPLKQAQFSTYKESIESYSGISLVAGTRHHMGYGMTSATIEASGQKEEIRIMEIGPEYLQTMEMKLEQGGFFQPESEEDKSSVIVNPFFIDAFEIKNALDHRILIDGKPFHIVGIVEEFYPNGLWRSENEVPMLLKLSKEEDFAFIVANVSGDIQEADNFMKKTWLDQFPNTPYESDVINMHVERSELLSANMGVMNIFLAVVALFLSATGLFTLISINVQKRMKEIGLRKIMGASAWNIVKLVNKGYLVLIFISLVIGCGMGAYLTELFLDMMFSIHAHPGSLAIGLTSVVVIVILLLTGSLRVLRAAHTNPVETLKIDS